MEEYGIMLGTIYLSINTPQIAQLISNFSLVRAFHTAILWLYEKPWFQVKDSIWHSMYSLSFSINMRFIFGGKCLVVCQSF